MVYSACRVDLSHYPGPGRYRGRGRPKLTWDESVMRDLKDWNISKEITLDRSAWRLAINVPEPSTYFFRVSSLAYPNLLGKKAMLLLLLLLFSKHKNEFLQNTFLSA